jgi:multidrug resistance efflux pump
VKNHTAPRANSRRIFAAGSVEGTQRDIPLHFEVSGRISRILVSEGDQVDEGDVLAELDAEGWDLKLAEALARLKLARAERDRLVNGASPEARAVLKAEFRAAEVQVRENEALLARGKQLQQRSAISTQELDDQRYKYEKAAAHLQTARARLEELEAPVRKDDLGVADAKVALAETAVRQERTMVAKTRLRSPSRGIILHVAAEPGQLAGPEDGRDLFTIANRDSTRVRAQVEELDALSVVVGQKAVVMADGQPGHEFHGIVQSCSPHVRPKSQKHFKPGELIDVRVREVVIELTNADGLVNGLPVDVFIERDLPAARGSAAPGESAAPRTSPQAAKKRTQPSVRVEGETSDSRRSGTFPASPRVSAVKPRAEIAP